MKKVFLVLFLGIFSFSSCNKNEKIQLSIERLEVNLSKTGLSSEVGFHYFSDSKSNSLKVFDSFSKAFFDLDLGTTEFKKIYNFEFDGPDDFKPFSFFVYDNFGFYIFEGRNSYLVGNKDNEKSNSLGNLRKDVFSLEKYDLKLNSEFGNSTFSYDSERKEIYSIVQEYGNKNQSWSLIKIELNDPTKIDFFEILDKEKMRNHQISFKQGMGSLGNDVVPFLTKVHDTLIISYVFSNLITVFDLKTNKIIEKNYESKLHRNSKLIPNLKKDDFNSFFESVKTWNNDLSFGPVLPYKDSGKYFRLIKGESKSYSPFAGKVYLSILDENLDEIYETDLTEILPDLGYVYFSTKNGIYIQSQSENENLLKYHVINF